MLSGDSQQVADCRRQKRWDRRSNGRPDARTERSMRSGSSARKAAWPWLATESTTLPQWQMLRWESRWARLVPTSHLETADVALMADDLSHLPFAVGLSRQTSRIIRQNLWFSLGMVAFLVPATIFGLQMGAAVVFHEGSTLLVVVNALRLLAYHDD